MKKLNCPLITSYERDNETELDFAQARYYSNQHGRFNSPDPIMLTPERIVNPQQINLYVYAVNNPLYYSDPSGEIPVKLGKQSEQQLQKEYDNALANMIADPEDSGLQSALVKAGEKLNAVKEGNKIIGAWLDALKASGEDNALQLSDFTLTTEPVKDLADAARKAGESEATITNETKSWKTTGLVGTVIGGSIYLLQTSDIYQNTKSGGVKGTQFGDIPQGDFARLGGSFLRHEENHLTDNSEYNAYTLQERVLDNINKSKAPFKNQQYFQDIKSGIQNVIINQKKIEGIK